MSDPKEPFRKRIARYFQVPPEFLDGVTDRPFDEVVNEIKNQLDMSEQKKTIQLANGVAEEGDRVMNIGTNPIRRGIKGEFFSPNGHGYFVLDDSGEIHPLLEFDEWIILFSPTDALEAVEEEIELTKVQRTTVDDMSYCKGHNERVKLDAALVSLQNVKARIQQKRKGHD